jgi:putative endonuclease
VTPRTAVVIPNEVRDLDFRNSTLNVHLRALRVEVNRITSGRLNTTSNLVLKENHYYVYLLINWNHRVMYVGFTNDLKRRVYEHQKKLVKGFTEKYNINKLVYFEETRDVAVAIAREKEIKKWRREKKNKLVFGINPSWSDLSEGL